ncbi:hypothetical protein J5N97_010724 [Dioscorea zingiberensis]|uniref:Cell wall hydroxyproline-rich glycoprotein n=1 Tax=Dioscorea zingiberensis TaxID=325984 RepID=A0A9D5D0K3_9LILI|nr:hypothetical protein J5N97_010724 [Dioscorea zingiberensis]
MPPRSQEEATPFLLNPRLDKAYIALQAFKHAIVSDPKNFTGDWCGPHVCNYTGVYCAPAPDDKHIYTVAGIDLNHGNISGCLPDDLGLLTDLALLHINSNLFSGTLPESFSSLKLLFELDASNNLLSGPFPSVVLKLPSLKFLDIRFNSFHGDVPKEAFDLKLDAFFVNDNNFQFSLPENIGNSPVSVLVVANNQLINGCLPRSLANMSQTLNEIIIQNSNLSSCIPPELGNLISEEKDEGKNPPYEITGSEANDVPPIVLSPDSDKSHRAEVHNFFKRNFKFLVTDTVEEADTNRGSDNWPEHLGKFLIFHLYKENKDTQEALGVIGKMLGVQQRSFGFAGTKDKRSISTQRVTIFKQHAKKLAALNSRLIGIKVGDFGYVREGLVLGQLSGNRFTITLRGVVAESQDIVKAAADGLRRNGFINYYGLQIKQRPFLRDARGMLSKENGDIDVALRQFPRHLVAERAVLQCLKKCPGNYLQALKGIPRTLRMMYVHSYQSYLWNHAASKRVQKHEMPEAAIPDQLVHLVKVVDSEDLLAGRFAFDDVVLPLPGEFSITDMKGDYRRVFQRPVDFVWELLTYTDDNIPLAETDLDVISKVRPDAVTVDETINGNSGHKAKDENEEMTKMALQLEFTLPASCYATMAIRELLKTSTSVAYQKTINN